METEVQKRSGDAIVFYDEMVDARNMAKRIYSEIMDDELQVDSKGNIIPKNYSAAIAAVREVHTVAMDLAKMAVIATRYQDEQEKGRRLSPVMQAMINDIGVFGSPDEVLDAREATLDVLEDFDA